MARFSDVAGPPGQGISNLAEVYPAELEGARQRAILEQKVKEAQERLRMEQERVNLERQRIIDERAWRASTTSIKEQDTVEGRKAIAERIGLDSKSPEYIPFVLFGTPPAALKGTAGHYNPNPGGIPFYSVPIFDSAGQMTGARMVPVEGAPKTPYPPSTLIRLGQYGNQQKNAKEIAAGIMDGSIPPVLKGLSRSVAVGDVLAILHRNNFNFTKATIEYGSLNRWMNTMNSQQAVFMRQYLNQTDTALSIAEGLYNDWKRVGPNSGFPILNKVEMAAAMSAPGEMGEIARALKDQVEIVATEVSSVLKKGSASPTDKGLQEAEKLLDASWNEGQFMRILALLRRDLNMRRASLTTYDPFGLDPSSPYHFMRGSVSQPDISITVPSASSGSSVPPTDPGWAQYDNKVKVSARF